MPDANSSTAPADAAAVATAAAQELSAQTPAARKLEMVKAYYDAKTPEEKAAVVKKYPELEQVFSAANHS